MSPEHSLEVGIVACRDLVGDLDVLARYVNDALGELARAADVQTTSAVQRS